MAVVLTAAIVDAQPIFVEGVSQIIKLGGISVVGIGTCRHDAVSIVQEKSPDLLIIDINIPGCGIEAVREIARTRPQTKVVFLTDSEDDEHVSTVLREGAKGYVLKSVGKREFTKIIGDIVAGRVYMDPALAARLIGRKSRIGDGTKTLISQLTLREREILECVAGGKTNKEVACILRLGEKTIKHHMTNIMQKLEVRNRLEATIVLQREQALGANGAGLNGDVRRSMARGWQGDASGLKRG